MDDIVIKKQLAEITSELYLAGVQPSELDRASIDQLLLLATSRY